MIPVTLAKDTDVLSKRTRKLLAKRQSKATTLLPAKIDSVWTSFRRTKSGNEVASVLSKLFHDKCAYCEQEAAKDVEHFYPKSRFPNRMFTWTNLLLSCKNCNTEKLAEFPLDASSNAVLLNPTQDEPLEYICWDELSGKIIPNPDPARSHRATQTRDLLRLDQFSLAEERRNKLANVVYLLSRVVTEVPIAKDTIDRLRDELVLHRPWLGIIRQLFRKPSTKYTSLVATARAKLPQLNEWIRPWLDLPHGDKP